MLQINCQFNYKIGCNWNINGHQYMTHNNNYLCISIPSKVKKSLVWNEGVKTSAHLWAQCQWWSSVRSNPLSNQSQNHKYPKLLSIPVLNRGIQQRLCPQINWIWYVETNWNGRCKGQWDIMDKSQEIKQNYYEYLRRITSLLTN